MLIGGTRVFFQSRDEFAKRILHPGEIVRADEDSFTAECEEPLALAAGQEVNLYYEIERKFVQQPVRIMTIEPSEPAPNEPAPSEPAPDDEPPQPDRLVEFQTTGLVISAECRQFYRVTTVMAHLTAELGEELGCPLVDVSSAGFSVISTEHHPLETVLPATLIYEQKRFTGDARIQSIKELITGQTRYGLRHLETNGPTGLEAGQQVISTAIQRLQLKRRSGSH